MSPSKTVLDGVEIRLPTTAEDLPFNAPRRIGRYRLLKRLGAGGMGVVYAALAPDGQAVAVKTVHVEYAENPDFRGRFAREVTLLRKVGGACVVPLLDADVTAGRPWLVTPLIEGPTLGAHIGGQGPLTPALLRGLAVGVAEALMRIHSQGVVHRDLKPANVILSPSGPKVLDFGIARAVDETALTRTGSVVGSSGWISPQHYRGEAATFADDMFAWGALVAYAATGRPPFGSGAADAIAYRILREEPDLTGLDGPLAALVRSALDKSAQQRPSAAELVRVISGEQKDGSAESATRAVTALLHDHWSGAPVPTTQRLRVELPTRRAVPRKRPGRALALTSGAVALLLTVVSAGWWLGHSTQATDAPAEVSDAPGASEASAVSLVTSPALVGWSVEPDTPRPSDDAIGLHPFRYTDERSDLEYDAYDQDFSGTEPMWARILDDAELSCAIMLCPEEALTENGRGEINNSGYGTTPIQRQDVFDYFAENRPSAIRPEVYVVVDVDYAMGEDGVAEIIRLAEHFFP
ncbi:serine/threonine-protein kinase [Nocardiopsis prasina]|uniref:serine/threonine-protein kinase n=1 Tax=Nocardiopsis prasina TaxID=2015 RepID=UPI00034C785B|nr:serine/threonine-protein kinase [Nocardiopsis prasina]